MADTTTMKAVTGATIAYSFILVGMSLLLLPPPLSVLFARTSPINLTASTGNAVTQSFMGVPALLVDFPAPRSPSHAERARLLGRQWPVFWAVGNNFFRPISTLGIAGYGAAAWAAASIGGNWKPFAIAAACHAVNVVHSAVNMQPINERIASLGKEATGGKGEDKSGAHSVGSGQVEKAEEYAQRWRRLNLVRLVMPLIAGTLAMTQVIGR
ncbi:hypothetical protein PG994_013848 [Apiospora phragmitis]|uniref:DUF1772-domain-containing protein n=1 Tax=Apiospora phragmitis TaxID=2905665 RepID=A0ABR1T2N4_9PEZI